MLSLFPDIHSILHWCQLHNIPLSICSKSSNYSLAEEILTSFKIWNLFHFPQVFYQRKSVHFRNLRAATALEYSDFLFYDDDPKNLEVCGNIGVQTCLVNKSTGLTWETFLNGFGNYLQMSHSRLPPQPKVHYDPLPQFGPQPPLASTDHKTLKLGHTAPSNPFSASFPRPSPLSSLDEGDEIHSCMSAMSSVDFFDDASHAMSSASADFSPSSSLDETDHMSIVNGRAPGGWYEFGHAR
jgi:hypothetical protein